MVDLLRDFLSSYLKAQHFAFCDPKDPTMQEQSKGQQQSGADTDVKDSKGPYILIRGRHRMMS
jgi:hypothetical protein